MKDSLLNDDERERYTRQLHITGWGEDAQQKLKSARIGIAGLGGLGSPVSLYLTALGAGTIVAADNDTVSRSNLNRQILYTENDLGEEKTEIAARHLTELNPHVHIETVKKKITDSTVTSIFEGCDIIIDCLDNFEARFALNRFAVANHIPFIHTGIRGFYGQLFTVHPPDTPCLACFLSDYSRDRSAPTPVCGPTAGVLGSLEAIEAVYILTGIEQPHYGKLLIVDLRTMSIEQARIEKKPDCPVCGKSAAF